MGFLDRLLGLFGPRKKAEPGLYGALEKQIDALENRLTITEHRKLIEGGIEGFDLAFEEARQMLANYGGERGDKPALDLLRRRMDLASAAAHLLREEDPQKRQQLRLKFLADFRAVRDQLTYRIKTKYERLRIDFESGRMK
jgi:phage shock protein A